VPRELPSSNETARGFVGSTSKCCWPSRGVVRPHWAVISMGAPVVGIVPPFRLTCRNRHCPKRQTAAREQWIAARRRELLPTRYLHVAFTLPRRLAPLVLQNKKVLYDLLFRTSAETLLEVARDPRLLGAEIGFFSVLHTWSQQLRLHPHLHIVIPAGGLSPDHTRRVRSRNKYFLPRKVLRRVFRGKFVDALEQAFQDGLLRFEGKLKLLAKRKIFAAWLRPLYRKHWVVYLKHPFGGHPEYSKRWL
jgi:Putative transposase/Transposase zinc-binding domain